MQDVSTVLPVSTVMLITRRRARGVDEVFTPVWFQSRPIKARFKTREAGRSISVKGGWCAFPARSTPDHKSYRFKRVREMINNFTTHLKEETSAGYRTQGLVCH